MISSGRLLRRRQQQTGVPDIIVENRAISAIVSDAATYGRHRYYAYSYYRGVSPMVSPRYDMPYSLNPKRRQETRSGPS